MEAAASVRRLHEVADMEQRLGEKVEDDPIDVAADALHEVVDEAIAPAFVDVQEAARTSKLCVSSACRACPSRQPYA
jgi:hypothetical protein